MILGIYGAHGLGREVYVSARKINAIEQRWQDFVFIDDVNDIDTVAGRRVFRFDDLIKEVPADELEIVVAVGEPAVREKMFQRMTDHHITPATLIHPGVYIDETTHIGAGAVICEGVTLTCDITIGDNAYIQPHVVIGHDITIGKHTVIGAGSQIGGTTTIGDRVYMGFLSGVREKLTIGNDTICSAGAIVFQSLPENVVAVGNPARIMKHNDNHRVFK